MIVCPYCDADNIEGADVCEQCGQSLSDLHPPRPATVVEQSLLKDRVDALNPRQPLTVAPDTEVRDVLQLLADNDIGCAVVVDNDQVVGIFSERDALMKLNVDFVELGQCPVSQFMTASPQSLDSNAKIAFAVRQMDQGGYRHVPIVDGNGRLTGIISVRDILRYLTEQMTSANMA